MSAAVPDTNGAAKLVPSKRASPCPGTAATTDRHGATRSTYEPTGEVGTRAPDSSIAPTPSTPGYAAGYGAGSGTPVLVPVADRGHHDDVVREGVPDGRPYLRMVGREHQGQVDHLGAPVRRVVDRVRDASRGARGARHVPVNDLLPGDAVREDARAGCEPDRVSAHRSTGDDACRRGTVPDAVALAGTGLVEQVTTAEYRTGQGRLGGVHARVDHGHGDASTVGDRGQPGRFIPRLGPRYPRDLRIRGDRRRACGLRRRGRRGDEREGAQERHRAHRSPPAHHRPRTADLSAGSYRSRPLVAAGQPLRN